MAAVLLLAAVVALVVVGRDRIRPAWAAAGGVAVGLVTGIVHVPPARHALDDLAAPLGFLAAAVPLATLLGEVGFFDAVAARVPAGRRLTGWLWVLAAAVTTVFNLDAAIVLLTPIYLRIGRRHGLDPVALGFQPVLLAAMASSALPVSNLTNLIAADRLGLTAGDFLVHLGPASVAAVVVGWFAYRRRLHPEGEPVDVVVPTAPAHDPRAWRVGLPAVVVLLVGFTVGDSVGLPAWVVALAVVAGLVAVTRHLPWRSIPLEAVLVAAGLGILAVSAAPHLGIEDLLAGHGVGAQARAFGSGVVGADAVNNLPALLVGLPVLPRASVWAFLVGVNMGPVLWLSGSLAGLLWSDVMRANGHPVGHLAFAKVGVRVGLPALLVAGAVVVALSPR